MKLVKQTLFSASCWCFLLGLAFMWNPQVIQANSFLHEMDSDGQITGFLLNKQDGSALFSFTNGVTFCESEFPHDIRIRTTESGNHQSLKFTITGPGGTWTNTENHLPYDSKQFWPTPGTWTIKAELYSHADLGGTRYDTETISIIIVDCNADPCANEGGDSDGDGVCDNQDCNPSNSNISSPGDACNDGNSNTENDVIQSDCSCVGTPVAPTFDCPTLGANIGDACNDGNSNTNNDVVTANCACAGTPTATNTCDATFRVEGNKIIIEGLNAAITTAKILTNTYGTEAECSDWATPCDGMLMATVAPGSYFVQIQTYADWSTPLCDIFEEVTVGGGAPTFDCSGLNANIGDACNDGNANTNNDVVTANCGCAGTPTGPTTCDATFRVEGNKIIIEGLNAAITTAKILTNTYGTEAECSDWATPCDGMLMATVAPGSYFVQIQTYADWSTPLCDIFEEVTVGGSAPTFDCSGLNANIGDACNDGNANTNNDVVTANCGCAGTPVTPTCTYYKINNSTLNCGTYAGSEVVFLQKDCNINVANIWTAGSDLHLIENANGTAQIAGTIHNGNATGVVNVSLSGFSTSGQHWSLDCYDDNVAPQYYYTSFNGTVVTGGQTFTIEPKTNGADFVFGNGANSEPNGGFSFGAWASGSWATCLEVFGNLQPLSPGAACDDGNPNTNNDVVTADCGCAGTPAGPTFDCAALGANIGDSCNDGNANTTNDVVTADCGCAGTPVGPTFDCAALGANIGDSCNDGNANTNNDVVTASCECAGTPTGPSTCDATYRVEGNKIIIEGLDAAINSAKILTNTYGVEAECNDWATACNGMLMATVANGTYFVQIQTYADWSTPLCDIFETVVVSGNGGGTDGCDNVTSGGSIAGDETGCGAYNPGPITNAASPSGGSGNMEFIWLSSTTGCPRFLSETIEGANQSTYDPGMITQTTYYLRCSRRAGCSVWTVGESNCVVKTVDNNCNTECANRNATNSTSCRNGGSYGVFNDGNQYTISDGKFIEFVDGTAILTGQANGLGAINVTFTGRTTNGPVKFNNCVGEVNTDDWYYYSNFSGTIGNLTISPRGEEFHIGTGGNNQNPGVLGASGWYQTSDGILGDINILLSGNASACFNSEPVFDCPALGANIGDACNDGDANTDNDQIQSDCSCAGTSTGGNNGGNAGCNLVITTGLDYIEVSGVVGPFPTVGILDDNGNQIFSCHAFNGGCPTTVRVDGLAPGTYWVNANVVDSDWVTVLCDAFEDPVVGGAARLGNGNINEKTVKQSISVEAAAPGFTLYPNPATETANVSLIGYEGKDVTIQMIDFSGKSVKSVEIDNVQDTKIAIPINRMSNGIYTIRVLSTGIKPVGKKMIVNKRF